MNEVQRITGRAEFKAVVEVDNLPSQKCFEKLGAKLDEIKRQVLGIFTKEIYKSLRNE